MKALWGMCIAAAMLAMGFVAWTYTVEPEDVELLAQLLLAMDLGMIVTMVIFTTIFVRLPTKDQPGYGMLREHLRAWRRRMPMRVVWMTVVMMAAGVVLTLYNLSLTLPVSEVDGKYRLSTGKFSHVDISRQDYVAGRSSGHRLLGSAGVFLWSFASVAFTMPFGTTRNRGYPA